MLTMRLLTALFAVMVSAAEIRAEAAAPVPEKDDLAVLMQSIRSNRKAMVAASLGLSEDQAAKFWPLYDEYQKALAPSGDRMAAVIDEYITSYQKLSNEKALELIKGYGDAEAERLQVRRSYIDRFAVILPGRTVARFYQIENKMDAVLRYDLAATIPVVEEQPAAAE